MKKISEELLSKIIEVLNKPEGVNTILKAGIINTLSNLESVEEKENAKNKEQKNR